MRKTLRKALVLSASLGIATTGLISTPADAAVSCVGQLVDSGTVCEVIVTSSQSWSIPSGVTKLDVAVVGGGGGAASTTVAQPWIDAAAGGGGGGGVSVCTKISVTPGSSVTVTVGAGANWANTFPQDGGDGSPSSFGTSCTADGGKGGKKSTSAALGGQGGVSGNGNAGGSASYSGTQNKYAGGGGGGAGAAGADGVGDANTAYKAGNGGAGLKLSTVATPGLFATDNNYYGGGGAGGGWNGYNVNVPGSGGIGGGGGDRQGFGNTGVANTGGGGQGGSGPGWGGAAGGSGVVKIRYALVMTPDAPGTPGTPTVVSGTNKVTITPTAPTTGGTPDSYLVTANPGGQTCTVTLPDTSCDISGLDPNTEYTFTTTATNTGGTSAASGQSAGATPTPAAPGTPGAPTTSPGEGKVTVTPTAPSDGGAVESYLVTAMPGGLTCTVTLPETSCDIEGLDSNTNYTFTASATNRGGTSAESVASDETAPLAPGIADNGGTGVDLAETGYNAVWIGLLALMLLAGGGYLVVAGRRRR